MVTTSLSGDEACSVVIGEVSDIGVQSDMLPVVRHHLTLWPAISIHCVVCCQVSPVMIQSNENLSLTACGTSERARPPDRRYDSTSCRVCLFLYLLIVLTPLCCCGEHLLENLAESSEEEMGPRKTPWEWQGNYVTTESVVSQCRSLQWSHSEFSKIPRSCCEKSQDWTKVPKLYTKHEKTRKMRTILHSQI